MYKCPLYKREPPSNYFESVLQEIILHIMTRSKCGHKHKYLLRGIISFPVQSFPFLSFSPPPLFLFFWVSVCCQCQSCLKINESTCLPIKWRFRHLTSFSTRPLNFLFYCYLISNFGYFDAISKEIRTCVLIPTNF